MCCGCFYFVHDTFDVVNEMSKAHDCGSVITSVKNSNLSTFNNFITSISGSGNSGRPTSTGPPPPPPLPRMENSIEKSKLSWNEIKALRVKKFPMVVARSVELPKVKQILKCAPATNTNAAAYIALQDQLNAELEEVLK